MAIYTISDLHLSFGTNKPMNIFGDAWNKHTEKIEKNWKETVSQNDTVVLPGDFSWAMNFEESRKDLEFLNGMPGRKILLKGNHDYWWGTAKKIYNFLKENSFWNIDILYNNSYLVEDKIICGTRGWDVNSDNPEDIKILNRENIRLEMSIQDGIKRFGSDKKIISFLHYPPINKNNKNSNIFNTLKKYGVSKCYYGHLHGEAHKEAIQGEIESIDFELVSCDYTDFKLIKID